MSELNLIPTSIKEQRAKKLKRNNAINISIIVISVLFLGLYFPYLMLTNLRTEENDLKKQIQADQSIVNEYNDIKTEIDRAHNLIQKVKSIEVGRSFLIPTVKEIENFVPSGMTFKALEYTQGSGITVTAEVSNVNDAAIFVANLQATEKFRNCQINGISDLANGLMSVTITILVI